MSSRSRNFESKYEREIHGKPNPSSFYNSGVESSVIDMFHPLESFGTRILVLVPQSRVEKWFAEMHPNTPYLPRNIYYVNTTLSTFQEEVCRSLLNELGIKKYTFYKVRSETAWPETLTIEYRRENIHVGLGIMFKRKADAVLFRLALD